MHQSNEDIYQKVGLAAIEARISMIKIIVTVSLGNDTMDLPLTLNNLVLTFGDSVMSSVVVLITKSDVLDPLDIWNLLDRIRKVAKDRGLPTAPGRTGT
jgi:hypothetical protein